LQRANIFLLKFEDPVTGVAAAKVTDYQKWWVTQERVHSSRVTHHFL
jgi:hypothetical protein